MALNPRLAAQGMADYDAANLASKASGGWWNTALSMYNGGSHPNAQAQAYSAAVGATAQQVQHALGITATVQDQNGNTVGRTKTQHNIDTSKKVVAAQSYGPTENTSPTVGLPLHLPGHIK